MKKKQLLNLMFVFVLFAAVLAACAQDVPEVEELPTAVAAVEEAVEEVAAEPTAEMTEEVVEEAPEIMQPIALLNTITDQPWLLLGYGDAANPTVVEQGTVITAVFSSDGAVSGSSGCNNYFGSFTADDQGNMTIEGPLGSTMMACETGMEQEAAYLAALQTVTGYAVNEEGRLELTYDTGEPLDQALVFGVAETPLVGTTWSLVSMGDPEAPVAVVPGTAVTASFASDTEGGMSGTVAGSATCNNYNTSWMTDADGAISFGPVATTMMLCPLGGDQEPMFLAALESAQTYEIVGSQLNITYDGGVLVFSSLSLPLENVLWTALSVGGVPAPMDASVTALFSPNVEEEGTGTISGSAGCNNYNAGYTVSGDSITVAQGISTLRACADPAVDEFERLFNTSLASAESFDILGEQMVLRSPDGDIFFVADREPLEGTLWTLISLGDINEQRAPVEGSNFTAVFDRVIGVPSGIVSGETGCNAYNATYTANLTEIKVNLPATTRVACPDGLAEEEQAFFLGLNAATTYRILGNVLQIPYGEPGSEMMLTFEGSPIAVEVDALDLTPLAGTFWYLAAIGDQTILPGTEVTAQFDINEDGITGTISGAGGCNGYSASIEPNFVMGPIASTLRACEPGVSQQETTYFSWLETAQGFSRVGDQLLIPTANGVLTFNSTPILDQAHLLRNVTWYLVSYETLTPVAGANPTAFFDVNGTAVSGTTGCNQYTGAYNAGQGNTLAISDIASTLAACATDQLTQQQDSFQRLMISAVSYAVNGSALQIRTVDGGTMNFTSSPPAAPVAPTAVITGPTSGEVGQSLRFDATSSQPGSSPIVRYQWALSDGNTLSGSTIDYVFTVPGTYVITLTAVDQAGRTGSVQQTVTIAAAPVPDTPPTAVITGPGLAAIGEQVTFSAAGSTAGTNPIATYAWQSGDGNNTGPVTTDTFTTIYSAPGVYFPTVTVSDANGLSATATLEVRVNASLDGVTWSLTTAAPDTVITIQFANGNLSGSAGCNTYNAMYTSTMMAGPTNNISVGPITATGALCPEDIMAQETAYLASLETANQYTIDGSTLTLTTADGTLVYTAIQA